MPRARFMRLIAHSGRRPPMLEAASRVEVGAMQSDSWSGRVEIVLDDDACVGEATLRMQGQPAEDGTIHWTGELQEPTHVDAPTWPAGQPVWLRLPDGPAARVTLDPKVQAFGPVLVQVVRIQAEPGELDALLGYSSS